MSSSCDLADNIELTSPAVFREAQIEKNSLHRRNVEENMYIATYEHFTLRKIQKNALANVYKSVVTFYYSYLLPLSKYRKMLCDMVKHS